MNPRLPDHRRREEHPRGLLACCLGEHGFLGGDGRERTPGPGEGARRSTLTSSCST
ncbi:MAG: hypothetical protein MZV63_65145 [Marinilabiliales bacterium]|nr:hypothetical protein [Marinilabiliales bacterium]